MISELTINYGGIELDVQYTFKKGKGFISREIPPDEDDLDIINVKNANGGEIPFTVDDIGIIWDIEQMIMSKIVN